ncbi:MAG: FkbM family methyltransferase [Desulfuromonadales bacterium]
MSLCNNLPITRIKLCIARILYRVVHLVSSSDRKRITRHGISYDIDISEGIDLSLFLFGNFQRHVTEIKGFNLPPDGTVIDVGANIGVMTLSYAQKVPKGRVYAFEPTHFALGKLQRNISLNPELASRIEVIHAFASGSCSEAPEITAYSSWKIDGDGRGGHPVHGGTAQDAANVPAFTLDNFCHKRELSKIDLIKIDTDGHEMEVLQGMQYILEHLRPAVIFEATLSLIEENATGFRGFYDIFVMYHYQLTNSRDGKLITLENYKTLIPMKGGIDILALPN